MEFLENLLLHQYNIEEMKNKIKEDISNTKSSYTTFESKINTLRDFLKKMIFTDLNELIIENIKIKEENCEKVMKTLRNNLDISEKNLKMTTTKIKKYEEQYREKCKLLLTMNNLKISREETEKSLENLSDIEKKHIDALELIKKTYIENKDFLQSSEKLKETEIRLSELSRKNEDEIQSLQIKLSNTSYTENNFISSLKDFKQKLLKIYEIDDKIKDEPDYNFLIEQEESLLKKNKEEFQYLQQKINELEKCYTCPSCNKTLKMNSQKLIIYHYEDSKDNIEKMKLSIDELKKSIHLSEKKITELHKKSIIYESLLSEYNLLYDKIDEISKKYGFEQDLDWINDKNDKIEVDNKNYDDLSKKIKDIQNDKYELQLKKELEEINKKLKKYRECETQKLIENNVKNEDEYLSLLENLSTMKEKFSQKNKLLLNLQRINNEISLLEQKMKEDDKEEDNEKDNEKVDEKDYEKTIQSEVEKQTLYEKKIESYKNYIIQLENWIKIYNENKKYIEIEESIESSENEKEYLNNRMRCLVKLRDHIKYTEKKCIDDFIESLNAHASIYIEHFFPDEDISICLKTTQETKDKREKPCLNFFVQYKNLSGDLKFLSGGERDRVNLAFTLAFSELVDNKMLLLDECISSLDAETTNVVLEHIKEQYKGSLVLLVSHQANLGFFDHIVQL